MLTMTNDFQVQLNMFLFKKCNVSIMGVYMFKELIYTLLFIKLLVNMLDLPSNT